MQAMHASATMDGSFLLHAIDQRSDDGVLVHGLLAFKLR